MSTIKEHTLAIVNELLDQRIADNIAPFLITETELFSAIRESINQLCRENELLFGKAINLIYFTNKKCIAIELSKTRLAPDKWLIQVSKMFPNLSFELIKQQKKIDAQAETIEYQSNKLNKRQQYQHKAKQFIFKPKRK